jgi:ribosomal protein S20
MHLKSLKSGLEKGFINSLSTDEINENFKTFMRNYHKGVEADKAQKKLENSRNKASNTAMKTEERAISDLISSSQRDSSKSSISPSFLNSSKWNSSRR